MQCRANINAELEPILGHCRRLGASILALFSSDGLQQECANREKLTSASGTSRSCDLR